MTPSELRKLQQEIEARTDQFNEDYRRVKITFIVTILAILISGSVVIPSAIKKENLESHIVIDSTRVDVVIREPLK